MSGMGMGLGLGITPSKGGGLAPYVGPLDGYSNIFMARSVRRLRTAYAGACLRVRRSSDNAEMDIGFTADGWLDETALLTHCGAGNGFVRWWYDQSGNGRDAGNATGSQQPRIVNAGVVDVVGARPALRPDGVDDVLNGASTTWAASDMTLSEVALIPTTSGKAQAVFSMGVTETAGFSVALNINGPFADWGNNAGLAYGNGFGVGRAPRLVLATPGFNDNALHIHTVRLKAGGSTWETDGVAKTAAVSGAGVVPAVTSTFSLDSTRSGYALEKILFAANQDTTALTADQKTAFSIP